MRASLSTVTRIRVMASAQAIAERDLTFVQADEAATDQPLCHVEVAVGVDRQAMWAIEFAGLQQAGRYNVPGSVFVIGPSLNLTNFFIVAKVADKFIVLSAHSQPGSKLGNNQQFPMGNKTAGCSQEIAAKCPLISPLKVINLDPPICPVRHV